MPRSPVWYQPCSGGLLVLVVAEHQVGAAGDDLARYALGIVAEYLHLHAIYGHAHGGGHEVLMVAIGDERGTLGGAVAARDGEADVDQELFHLLIEGSSTHDDFLDIAAEGFDHLVADGLLHLLAHHGHVEQEAYGVVLNLREHALADDFLDDQRHGDDDMGLDVLEGLCDDGRRRQAGEEEQMTPVAEAEDELEGHAVHMGHGEDGEHVLAGLDVLREQAHAEVQVAPERAVGEHDSLGEARGARGVVDEGQFFGRIYMIMHMLGTEEFGVFPAVEFVEVLAGIFKFL